MDSLDFPTHQHILNDLAVNLASDIANIPSHVQTLFANPASSSKVKTSTQFYLSSSAARTQIGLALFASSISSAARSNKPNVINTSNDQHLVPVLDQLDPLLNDLTLVHFLDYDLSWTDWSIPDQLAYALVSSFLQISENAPHHRTRCIDAILTFASKLAVRLSATSGDAHAVAVTLCPLFNGFYRAISSVSFGWSIHEFARLSAILSPIIKSSSQVVRRLNQVLLLLPEQQPVREQAARAARRVALTNSFVSEKQSELSIDTFSSDQNADLIEPDGGFTFATDSVSAADNDQDYRLYLLGHYRRIGSPISGHQVLLTAFEILETVLVQTLALGANPLSPLDTKRKGRDEEEDLAQQGESGQRHDSHGHPILIMGNKATTNAWKALLRHAVDSNNITDPSTQNQNQHVALFPADVSRIFSTIPVPGSNGNGNGNGSAAFDPHHNGFNGAKPFPNLDHTIQSVLCLSNLSFQNTQRFIESEGSKSLGLLTDLYTAEILATTFKLSALCSVYQHLSTGSSIDSDTFVRIRTLLSESTPIVDPVVQTAALQSVGLIVRNLPSVALPMTRVLRHFVTSPLALFEAGPNGSLSPVLLAAARCLASCVTIAPGDDLVVSTMYTLLNYLGKDSATGSLSVTGAAGSGVSVQSGSSRPVTLRDHIPGMLFPASQTHFNARNDDQKRLINLCTITVITRLALEVAKPDITALTISMLLQRLRAADPIAQGVILDNLVPLALVAPKDAYLDVIKAFSAVSRSVMTGGANRRAAVGVYASQLKLARGLGLHFSDGGNRREASDPITLTGGRKELYLVELLTLFAEKGVQLQSVAASNKTSSQELAELTADLANLLPAISALLQHDDINPHLEPTTEMVSLFRNLWFLSVLFGYASSDRIQRPVKHYQPTDSNYDDEKIDNHGRVATAKFTLSESHAQLVRHSLSLISLKTPTLVPETAHNYIESEIEYNSVLKREFSHVTLDSQRKSLISVIPSHASEIRSFSYAQVTFLATIYDLECLRSSMGRPSMILWYFVNEGLNTSSLVGAMQAIADKVIGSFIYNLGQQVGNHSLDPRVSHQVKNLMLGCCHRVAKVRNVSHNILNKLIYALPSLLCDQDVMVTMLEILTLLRQGCECEYTDEYAPVYHFHSERANIGFDLSDSYAQRNEILSEFLQRSRDYLSLVMGLAPVELQGILQRYLGTFHDSVLPGRSELGKSVALDFARSMPAYARQDTFLPPLGGWKSDASSNFIGELSAKSTYLGEMTGIHLALTQGLVDLAKDPTTSMSPSSVAECRQQLAEVALEISVQKKPLPLAELRRMLYRSAALVVALPEPDYELLHYLVSIPFLVFSPEAISTACQVWTWIIGERPEVETKIMVEISTGWGTTAKARRGLFSAKLTSKHPFLRKTEMGAFNRDEITAEQQLARKLFTPHLTLIHLLSSRYQAFRYRDPTMVLALVRLIQRSGSASDYMSTHPLAREARFALIIFGFRLIQTSRLEGLVEHQLREALYKMVFGWFAVSPQWSFGGNRLQVKAEMQTMDELLDLLRANRVLTNYHLTSFHPCLTSSVRQPEGMAASEAKPSFTEKRQLLQVLVENEYTRFSVWANPLGEASKGPDFVGQVTQSMNDKAWTRLVDSAWKINAAVAVQLGVRFKSKTVTQQLGRLIRSQPHRAVHIAAALKYVVEDHLTLAKREGTDLKWLRYWAAVSPVEAINLFQPEFDNHPMVLQYAMRTLEQHPVELTFFYVPQVVQALRDDGYGYVERFIFETSKISRHFCHQIIWNMKANSYRDDDAEVPDPMKPSLDRMVDNIVDALSGEAQQFYEREFTFFNQVTSISGKLKPYIKKSKPEKKAKIDLEMAKIHVDPGVYLPSNPDGVVVDLDRKSGRPLQSHAKAPFMATFKVHREMIQPGNEGDETTPPIYTGVDVWQAAIFKVGDDCRQDVLALQVIAMFKNVYTTVGIDLYLNPYRVTTTGPGCGVIDVVPNATSRDEMGRAKINNLLAFFIGRYGNTDSVAFQKARINFIQSMAAYSVVCHILQIRDRHNGNMMIDGEGHLVHIDFGFLFDIGPGGMHFEPYSFKLSYEMIEVMGGSESQGYRMFEELVVKAFLTARVFHQEMVDTCKLMLGTQLPSFKGYPTIERLRERFKPNFSERQAANHAKWLVKDAFGNRRSVLYDKLQQVTNDIPFAR